jgi:hypothetical protein
VQDVVKSLKFSAYQANITAYTASLLAYKCDGRITYEEVWKHQNVSTELKLLIAEWAPAVDAELRRSAGMRMPTEWSKRAECWESIKQIKIALPSHRISELSA